MEHLFSLQLHNMKYRICHLSLLLHTLWYQGNTIRLQLHNMKYRICHLSLLLHTLWYQGNTIRLCGRGCVAGEQLKLYGEER